jgi:protease IV
MEIWTPWGARIGVLELLTPIIGTRRVISYINLIDSLKKSPRIKSVILNIDSPGGTATASDYLYTAVGKLSAKKPVVAFISGAGASGAYLVSCAATKIVALPSAMIGSIGVLSVRPVLQDLLQRAGIHISVTKSGRLKDMGAPYREMTEEEKKKEQELIDSFYDYFIRAVAKGRNIDERVVRELATGEVFLGEKARSLGLVDEVGDFDTALDLAAKLGKVPRRFTYFRPRPTLPERLLSRFAASLVEETLTEVEYLASRQIYYLG